MCSERGSVKHVVVDSGAFIKNAPISTIAENVYTLRDVVSEIRDQATRQRLQVLPYEIKFKEPAAECIRQVTEFSKKTGDYPSLSAIDIRVMALAYQLEKEHMGTDHIKLIPDKNVSWTATKSPMNNPLEIAGFYLDKKTEQSPDVITDAQKNLTTAQTEANSQSAQEISQSVGQTGDEDEEDDTEGVHQDDTNTDNQCNRVISDGHSVPNDLLEEDSDNEEEDSDVDEEDDDGWITPSNLRHAQESLKSSDSEKANVTVGCITTDFAMQNVLIQMGLNVVSLNGMLIKRLKSYILRCYACFKTTTNMMKQFCFHCGNKTLQKVSVSVENDGSIRYFLSRKKQISTKGMKFSLPTPKGGKHAVNPQLVEDQRQPQQRQSRKARIKYDVFDPDYASKTSPFAPIDTHSRAAQLGIRNHRHNFQNKRNPNENKKVYGRRK